MFGRLKALLFGNLRKQLTVGIVLVVTAMISLFVLDMTRRQQAEEMEQHSEQVTALASNCDLFRRMGHLAGFQRLAGNHPGRLTLSPCAPRHRA